MRTGGGNLGWCARFSAARLVCSRRRSEAARTAARRRRPRHPQVGVSWAAWGRGSRSRRRGSGSAGTLGILEPGTLGMLTSGTPETPAVLKRTVEWTVCVDVGEACGSWAESMWSWRGRGTSWSIVPERRRRSCLECSPSWAASSRPPRPAPRQPRAGAAGSFAARPSSPPNPESRPCRWRGWLCGRWRTPACSGCPGRCPASSGRGWGWRSSGRGHHHSWGRGRGWRSDCRGHSRHSAGRGWDGRGGRLRGGRR